MNEANRLVIFDCDGTLVDSQYRAVAATQQKSGLPPLIPGIREVLQQLSRAGFFLAVATGNSRGLLDQIITGHDLADFFLSLQCADLHPGKPHPSMIYAAMADTGAKPETTVMAGDSSCDMEMARNARSYALGVTWGCHSEKALRQAGAHHVAGGCRQLVPMITALLDGNTVGKNTGRNTD